MKDFNFFDYLLKEKKKRNIKVINIVILVSVICTVMLVAYLINFGIIKKLNSEIAKNEVAIKSKNYGETQNAISEKEKMLKVINEYSEIVGGINSLIINSDRINKDLLLSINKTIPQNIILNYISLNSTYIFLEGISTSRQGIAEFEYNLKNTGLFSDIHINNISSEGSSFVFDIEAELKGGAYDEATISN
ncbi:hypothetical protein SH2C18_21490 [Clostridium sediminicola]|uniref:PilN domain-containing protein n=1 Tax=Clostridium sediminicola TaxID=3114879 RepID=UPI0031F20388